MNGSKNLGAIVSPVTVLRKSYWTEMKRIWHWYECGCCLRRYYSIDVEKLKEIVMNYTFVSFEGESVCSAWKMYSYTNQKIIQVHTLSKSSHWFILFWKFIKLTEGLDIGAAYLLVFLSVSLFGRNSQKHGLLWMLKMFCKLFTLHRAGTGVIEI